MADDLWRGARRRADLQKFSLDKAALQMTLVQASGAKVEAALESSRVLVNARGTEEAFQALVVIATGEDATLPLALAEIGRVKIISQANVTAPVSPALNGAVLIEFMNLFGQPIAN